MHHVTHSTEVDVPIQVCFDFVADNANVPNWLYSITKFDPVGAPERGLGTTVDVVSKLGPMTVHADAEVTDWVEGELIEITLTRGLIQGRTTWRFAPAASGATTISVEFAYRVASNLAGRALQKIIDSLLGTAIEHSERELREQLLRSHAA